MPALALLIVPHKHAHWITCSPTALSCGRSKYSIPFQLDCVPRKVFQSNSTSRPSAAKKPSCIATKSLRPMPLGATLTCFRLGAMAKSSWLDFVDLNLPPSVSETRAGHEDSSNFAEGRNNVFRRSGYDERQWVSPAQWPRAIFSPPDGPWHCVIFSIFRLLVPARRT